MSTDYFSLFLFMSPEVKKSSLQLIKQWKGMIRGGNESQDSIKRARYVYSQPINGS